VPLAPFSMDIVEHVFMRIEQPKHIIEFATSGMTTLEPSKTIGEFYGRIRDTFEAEGEGWIIDTTGATQPSHPSLPPGIKRITNVADALKAIDLIVEQGEGTESEPIFPDGDTNPNNDELAHYYKFAEMVKGRLKPNPAAGPASPPQERYIYDASDPVPFNAAAVLPLRTNPKSSHFDAGSPAREAIDAFNLKYTQVLQQLHAAFNGQPSKIFGAVDSMNGMGVLAADICGITLDDGTRPGPTFEYAIEPVTA
jgi:Ferritin-like